MGQESPLAPPPAPLRRRVAVLLGVGLGAVLVAAGLAFARNTRPTPAVLPAEVRPGEIALLDLALPGSPVREAVRPVVIGGTTRRGLTARGARVWHIPARVPTGADLSFTYGVTGPTTGGPDTRYGFTITADAGGDSEVIFRGHVRPTAPLQTGWQEATVPLDRFSGREVNFRFGTWREPDLAGAGSDYIPRVAVWGNPVLRYRAEPDARPDILLVVVDTLRADRLGAYGSPSGLTPHMDRLAAAGAVWERAFSQSSWTTPSVAALLTGLYPDVPLVERSANNWLPAGRQTLANHLGRAGYRCEGYVNNPNVESSLGFARGFDRYHAYETDEEVVAAVARRFVDPPPGPRFYYVHLLGAHVPYVLATPFAGRRGYTAGTDETWYRTEVERDQGTPEGRARIVAAYDSLVARSDALLASLLDRLQERQDLDDVAVFLTSDHGEEFWEHGGWEHGHQLHDEVLHVPLIARHPANFPAGTRVGRPVQQFDLMPTLLRLASAPPPTEIQARSLLPLDAPHTGDAPCVASGNLLYGRQQVALRCGDRKVILTPHTGQIALYDLAADPGEQVDRMPDQADPGAEAAAWRRRLSQQLSRLVTERYLMHLDLPAQPRQALDLSIESPSPMAVVGQRPPLARALARLEDGGKRLRIELRPGEPGVRLTVRSQGLDGAVRMAAEDASHTPYTGGIHLGPAATPGPVGGATVVRPASYLSRVPPAPRAAPAGAIRVWFEAEREIGYVAPIADQAPDRAPERLLGAL